MAPLHNLNHWYNEESSSLSFIKQFQFHSICAKLNTDNCFLIGQLTIESNAAKAEICIEEVNLLQTSA